jgi:hypothetical protein
MVVRRLGVLCGPRTQDADGRGVDWASYGDDVLIMTGYGGSQIDGSAR